MQGNTNFEAGAPTYDSGEWRDGADSTPNEAASENGPGPAYVKQGQTKPRLVTRRAARPATRAPKGFAFIASGPGGKPPEDTRRSIRSHVMRGKNTKRASSQQERNEMKKNPDHVASRKTAAKHRSASKDGYHLVPGYKDVWVRAGPFKDVIIHPQKPSIPRRLDLSLLTHPEAPDVPTQQLLRRFFVTMEQTMFPIELCFQPSGSHSGWQDWILDDSAYFFNSLFIASSFYDLWSTSKTPNLVLPNPDLLSKLSVRSNRYLQNTIELLQEHINDPKLRADDRTISVVMSLAMIYEGAGDVKATMAHFNGLTQMVKMRGGVKGLRGNMLREICRVDLGAYLRFGQRTEFHSGDIDWDPRFDKIIVRESHIPPAPITSPTIRTFVDNLDTPLHDAFLDLRAFTSIADRLAISPKKLRSDLMPEVISSVQNRCMALKYSPRTNLIDEVIRTGILAFLAATVLKVQGSRTRFDFIGQQVRRVLELMPEHDPAMEQLKLWLVYVGASAAIDSTEEWFLKLLQRLSAGKNWNQISAQLCEVMWIRVIQDRGGKELLEGSHDDVVRDSTLGSAVKGFWNQIDRYHIIR